MAEFQDLQEINGNVVKKSRIQGAIFFAAIERPRDKSKRLSRHKSGGKALK